MELRSARYLSRDFLQGRVQPGDICVDATVGNGHDTLYLAQQVGENGRVYGFDIQPEALQSAKALLAENGMAARATLFLRSHAEMLECGIPLQSARVILFNLGWLPGGDHEVTTRVESTLKALDAALQLLLPGGMLSVCIYPGHAEGSRELESVRAWAAGLDIHQYNALFCAFVNQRADAPRVLLVQRDRPE